MMVKYTTDNVPEKRKVANIILCQKKTCVLQKSVAALYSCSSVAFAVDFTFVDRTGPIQAKSQYFRTPYTSEFSFQLRLYINF